MNGTWKGARTDDWRGWRGRTGPWPLTPLAEDRFDELGLLQSMIALGRTSGVARRFHTPHEAADILHTGRLPATRVSERLCRISVPALEQSASGSAPARYEVTFRRVRHVTPMGEPVPVPTERELAER